MMEDMSVHPRHVLVVGADQDALDRVAPMLRRAEFEVHTVAPSPFVLDLVTGTSFELLVVTHPITDLDMDTLVSAVRGQGSGCRNAGFLLLADPQHLESAQSYVDRGVNRAVSSDWAPARLWQAFGDLLHVAPRVFLRCLMQVDVDLENPSLVQTQNISASGMLARGEEAFLPGTRFGFLFHLPVDNHKIEGIAEIVRVARVDREGFEGFGARFLSFRHDGHRRLASYIRHQLSHPQGARQIR
jgi:hypothetical protein